MNRGEQNRLFWILVAAAFLLRAVHVLLMSDTDINPLFALPIMDSGIHDEWARGILAGSWPGSEPFFRAPLYIYFLAGLYAVFGPEQRLPIQLIHALISALGAGLIGLSAARVWGRTAGWLAGIIFCVLWTSIYFSGELLIVTVVVTLDLLLLWLLLEPGYRQSDEVVILTPRRLLLIGLVWGLSAIGRPNILILAPIIIWYLFRFRGLSLRPRRWLWLVAGLALPILPVTVHNIFRGGDAVLIASQGGVNFYIGNNSESDGRTAWIPGTRPTWKGGFDDVRAMATQEAGRELKPSEIDRHYLRKGFSFWLEQPLTALRLYGHKLRLLLSTGERSNNKSIYFWRDRSQLLRWPVWPGWALVLVLGVIGLFRRDTLYSHRFLLLGTVLAYSFSILMFFVNARYRLPVAAFLAIPAGAGLARLIEAIKKRRWSDTRLGLGIALGLLLIAVVPDLKGFTGDKIQLDVFSWHTLGNNYAAAGRLSKAATAYQEALDINRRYPQRYFSWVEQSLYEGYGGILKQLGRHGEVMALYGQWVRYNPNHPEARVLLSDALMQHGRIDEAAAHLEVALRHHPDHFGARLGHAWILYQNGEYGSALRRFQELGREKTSVPVLFGVGLASMQLQMWSEAESAFKEVLVLDPDYWQAVGNLAGLYEQTGKLDQAYHAYQRLLRMNPQDERARRWLQEHSR